MINLPKTLFLEVLLLCVCYLGDNGPQNAVNSQIVRALADSLTHGLIGGTSWSIVCNIQIKVQDFTECLVCLILASLVDVDHFLSARSLLLKDALSLSSRPPFHASTIILVVDAILFLLLFINNSVIIKKLILMFTTAWISHHVRDASRRGLWLYPFGETPPLSKLTYHSVIVCLPLVFQFIHAKWIGNRSVLVLKDSLPSEV